MNIYNYFIILLRVCVSYDTQFDMIHDIEKSKIDSRYDSRFDNYGSTTVIDALFVSMFNIFKCKIYYIENIFDKIFSFYNVW